MRIDLHRYVTAASAERLPMLLKTPDGIQTAPLGITADMGEVWATFEELRQGKATANWDRKMVRPLHQALRYLSRRDAADMRFWHWLCIKILPDFVWSRWNDGEIPTNGDVSIVLQTHSALAGRFLGSSTLNGVSRNGLARLWWCAETLSDVGTDYTLVYEALTSQDFFQAIFERQFGLYPPAARACLRALRNASERERREATKRLNHYLTTIAAEALEEEDIVQLLTG